MSRPTSDRSRAGRETERPGEKDTDTALTIGARVGADKLRELLRKVSGDN